MSPIERSGGGGGSAAGGLVRLFTATLAAPALSIDTGAGGVPSGHGDLLIFMLLRSAFAGTNEEVMMNFNNDFGANYDAAYVRDAGGAVNSVEHFALTSARFAQMFGATTTANASSSIWVLISGYDTTTFLKSASTAGGSVVTNLGGTTPTTGGLTWNSTAAISRIAVSSQTGANLVTGSRMVIYGTQ
jgi:hypothetical protein